MSANRIAPSYSKFLEIYFVVLSPPAEILLYYHYNILYTNHIVIKCKLFIIYLLSYAWPNTYSMLGCSSVHCPKKVKK